MSRLSELFATKKTNILSIYFTAGYPSLHDTQVVLKSLQEAGADFVEIGIPFSDPVADGPTIQKSSEIALQNGMNLKLLFDQLKDIRKSVSMPLILMGYINPVLQFGVENFCKMCEETGIDGIILPDMPMQIYLEEYKATFEKHGLTNIFLITPQSSEERVKWIDSQSSGFIYMVSSYATTGSTTGFGEKQLAYFNKIKKSNIVNPTVVGFGISSRSDFNIACQYSNGAIIGSAFVKMLGESSDLKSDIIKFIKDIKS
ncbi:MAG: tryptophan synthase subunit alpha [Opitutaceae bacterium]|nr:tryptophan synthase subunit alpha [Cytophagales bacterium]